MLWTINEWLTTNIELEYLYSKHYIILFNYILCTYSVWKFVKNAFNFLWTSHARVQLHIIRTWTTLFRLFDENKTKSIKKLSMIHIVWKYYIINILLQSTNYWYRYTTSSLEKKCERQIVLFFYLDHVTIP